MFVWLISLASYRLLTKTPCPVLLLTSSACSESYPDWGVPQQKELLKQTVLLLHFGTLSSGHPVLCRPTLARPLGRAARLVPAAKGQAEFQPARSVHRGTRCQVRLQAGWPGKLLRFSFFSFLILGTQEAKQLCI